VTPAASEWFLNGCGEDEETPRTAAGPAITRKTQKIGTTTDAANGPRQRPSAHAFHPRTGNCMGCGRRRRLGDRSRRGRKGCPHAEGARSLRGLRPAQIPASVSLHRL